MKAMLSIDVIGLVFTMVLVGARYPHYVLVAALIHDLGRIMMVLFLHGNVETVVAAGAFGTAVASNIKSNWQALLITFSGPLANYIVSATVGGTEYEKTARLLNPLVSVSHPFAVVNLRLAVVSILVSSWLFWQ
ncbi:MAG: hypothetical protein H6Q74_618 [Firmicutes bacterium]|nr:hypothetical protein [Bacillota bacterium]